MRIAILNKTAGGISGGYKKYLVHTLPLLSADSRVAKILCATPPTIPIKDWFPELQNVEFTDCRPFSVFSSRPEPDLLARLDDFRPDIVFVPLERQVRYSKAPTVVMLQNMAPLSLKLGLDFPRELIRLQLQKSAAKTALRGAAHVIVPTIYVKHFIQDRLGISPEKVTTIHYGAIEAKLKPEEKPAGLALEPGRYIFTAGSIEPYRGLEDLFKAVALLKPRLSGVPLVITGTTRPAMLAYRKKLAALAASMGIADKIIWSGGIKDSEMSWLYNHSLLFVMTSRIEAGPNIALEALSHACACIAADNQPLPESFANAALYYSPHDGASLAEKMRLLLDDATARKSFSDKALLQAKKFSWDSTAEKTIRLFERLLSGPRERGAS